MNGGEGKAGGGAPARSPARRARAGFLLAPVATFLAFQSLDLLNLLTAPEGRPRQALFQAQSLLFALSVWVALSLGLRMLPRALRWAAAGGIGLVAAAALAANYFLLRAMGDYVNRHDLALLAGGPGNLLHYASSYLSWALCLPFLACAGAIALLWRPRGDRARPSARALLGLAGTAALALALGTGLSARRAFSHPAPDAALFLAVAQAATDLAAHSGKDRLYASDHRASPSPPGGPPGPNVVLVINESWGRARLSAYGHPAETMPRLRAWLDSEKERFLVFERAYSNAPVSDLSVPSLLTGVAPWEPNERLHEMPLPWGWAKAAGIGETCFVAASSFRWAGLDRFLKAPGTPGRWVTADEMGGGAVNDLGVDEMRAVRVLEEIIEATPADRKLFAVYYSNAAHYPFQDESPLAPDMPAIPHRYDRALWILDSAIGRIRDALARAGRLDDTLVILAADHGEYTERPRRVRRIESAYEDAVGVPLMIRLPPARPLPPPERLRALRENARRNVANVDVIPTLVEALGLGRDERNRALLARMSGQSLFSPVPEDRVILATSVNSVRRWDASAFAVVRGDERYVFSTLEGGRLFDLRTDPDQRRDLSAERPDRAEVFRRIVEGNPNLAAQAANRAGN